MWPGSQKPPYIHHAPPQPYAKLNKLEYAQYISQLLVKKGDLVCAHNAMRPLSNWNTYEVEDIQEIHYLCDMAGPGTGPLCLRLKAWNGNKFNGGGDMYVKAKWEDLTDEWKNVLTERWKAKVTNNVIDM